MDNMERLELLRMIMENNPGHPVAFILEQYAAYMIGLANIDSTFIAPNSVLDVQDTALQTVAVQTGKDKKPSLTCGYTKRHLKLNPADAVMADKIICCLCGKECKTITARHLATHNGLTREGYIKLCGYDKDQPLMALDHLARMKANVLKAQSARKFKTTPGTDNMPTADAKKAVKSVKARKKASEVS